jgi:hypothetical protein
LRSNPSPEGIAQLEASLTCEKLRAQVTRLRESLSSIANVAPAIVPKIIPPPAVVAAPPPPVLIPAAPPAAGPKQEAAPKPPEPPKVAVATLAPATECKQDEARLAKIRANPSLADLATLERDLSCERLRPQIVRLRESLPKELADAPKSDQPAVAVNPPVLQSAQTAPAETKPAQPGLVVQVRSCDEERATLAKLRASQSREDVVRFERELACEQLRPQVIRLRESLSGG